MAIKPAKMAVLGPNLKNDVPKYLEWARLAQYSIFHADHDGGVHFWVFWLVWELRAHKMAINPAKMAIMLSPKTTNL